MGTEASSVSPSILAELSELMLSRLRAGDGVEDDGSECDSLEIGCWASGEALGARGAGRFFNLGLLVGVMPYQGCRGLAAVSLCSCSGVLFWTAVLSSSSSSSSSKGLYDLGSVASDLLSSLLAFPTSSSPSSSKVLLGVSWLLPGGGGAGFFLGSACTKAIHGGSLALAAVPARSEEQGLPRGFGTGGLGSGTLPFTIPGPLSLASPWIVDLGRGTGCKAGGERASVDLLGAGVGRVCLCCPSSEPALSWLGTTGLLGRGGLGGIWEMGAPLPTWGMAVSALLGVLFFSSGLVGTSAGIWVSAMFSTTLPLSFPTSGPEGSTSSPTLLAPASILSSGDCRSRLGLLSIFPLMANLPRCCVQTKVPASEPGLYDPGSRVLEHSLHLKHWRW